MLRILHIEDDKRYLEIVRKALQGRDKVELEQVTTLEQALKRLSDSSLPCVTALLVDLILPDAHEMEAITALRVFNIPLIVLSGNAFPENLEKAAEAGADDYLIKYQLRPEEIGDQLVRRIRFALRRYVKHEQKVAIASSSKLPFPRRALHGDSFEALKPFICAIRS